MGSSSMRRWYRARHRDGHNTREGDTAHGTVQMSCF
jgi:hypothetical protein